MCARIFISRIWGNFFTLATRVFEVTDARPIWQQTVGIPDGMRPGNVRTYSLLTNRFPDHTSLYVRVQDKDTGVVYATYSLGRAIAFEQPQAEIDRANQLHVLHCAAPRAWSYSRIGLNGELLAHSSFMETKTRPRLVHSGNGEVAVHGGTIEAPRAKLGVAQHQNFRLARLGRPKTTGDAQEFFPIQSICRRFADRISGIYLRLTRGAAVRRRQLTHNCRDRCRTRWL